MTGEMSMLPCRHRLVPERESYCWRETSRMTEDGKALLFHAREGGPVRCGPALAAACPFRERPEPTSKAGMVPCSHCRRRHRQGSNSQQLCEAWSSTKGELARMRKELPAEHRFYEEGTSLLPYDEHTTALVRRLVWQKLKTAVLRRDGYRCQDCGARFEGRSRRVRDRKARGGFRRESLEVHHILPRAWGGSDHPGNLKTLCPSCHRTYTEELVTDLTVRRRERREQYRELQQLGYEDGQEYDPRDD